MSWRFCSCCISLNVRAASLTFPASWNRFTLAPSWAIISAWSSYCRCNSPTVASTSLDTCRASCSTVGPAGRAEPNNDPSHVDISTTLPPRAHTHTHLLTHTYNKINTRDSLLFSCDVVCCHHFHRFSAQNTVRSTSLRFRGVTSAFLSSRCKTRFQSKGMGNTV